MEKKYTIPPYNGVIILICAILVISLVLLVLSPDGERFAWQFFVVVSPILFFFCYTFIDFEPDQVVVRYLFGIKRRIPRHRISSIEFVTLKLDGHYLLITLDDFVPFSKYSWGIKNYIDRHPIKVISVMIPAKKRSEYVKAVTAYYPSVSFVNWDAD